MCLLVPTYPYSPINPSQDISLSKNIRKTNKFSSHAILATNQLELSATYFFNKGCGLVLAATANKSAGKIKRETSQTNSRTIKLEVQGRQLQAPSVNNENTTEAQTLNSEPQKSNAETNITQITASQN